MKLKVHHTTVFDYDSPVYETATEVRLTPASHPTSGQRCLDSRLQVQPNAVISRYVDCYGNTVEHFNLLRSHGRLEITAASLVETGLPRTIQPAPRIDRIEFTMPSRYTEANDAIRGLTDEYGRQQRPEDASESIARAIFAGFVYEPGVTGVHSTASEVMELRRGVCQDFAHVMIAACRVNGLPARYVSGYLYGGEDAEDGDRASHAWCEVYCGDELGWIGYDPTHSTIFPDERYVKIGIGRDYDDVPPVRGTYKGIAGETLTVSVKITNLDDTTAG